MASKRSISCCDGTWNDPDTGINVHGLVEHVEHDRTTQIVECGRGVDIAWYDGMTRGVCSIGLSRHVRQAYQFLFECYVPDDEISLFGYSRGAYTMRSLRGFMPLFGRLTDKWVKEQRHVRADP